MPSDKRKVRLAKGRKRTWRPPSVKTGALFESNSLACGKLPIDDPCQQGMGGGIRQS